MKKVTKTARRKLAREIRSDLSLYLDLLEPEQNEEHGKREYLLNRVVRRSAELQLLENQAF